jgi:hypothetical protein
VKVRGCSVRATPDDEVAIGLELQIVPVVAFQDAVRIVGLAFVITSRHGGHAERVLMW